MCANTLKIKQTYSKQENNLYLKKNTVPLREDQVPPAAFQHRPFFTDSDYQQTAGESIIENY